MHAIDVPRGTSRGQGAISCNPSNKINMLWVIPILINNYDAHNGLSRRADNSDHTTH